MTEVKEFLGGLLIIVLLVVLFWPSGSPDKAPAAAPTPSPTATATADPAVLERIRRSDCAGLEERRAEAVTRASNNLSDRRAQEIYLDYVDLITRREDQLKCNEAETAGSLPEVNAPNISCNKKNGLSLKFRCS